MFGRFFVISLIQEVPKPRGIYRKHQSVVYLAPFRLNSCEVFQMALHCLIRFHSPSCVMMKKYLSVYVLLTKEFSKLNMHNKAVIGIFFASLRFGVAAPLYPKTPLHKKFPIQRRYV